MMYSYFKYLLKDKFLSIRLLIILILVVTMSSRGSTRLGTGYYFKDKKVMKKFYANPKTHFIDPVTSRVYKAQILRFSTDDFIQTTSKYTGMKKSIYFETEERVINSIYAPLVRKPVYLISARFKNPYFMFVDFRPKKKMLLPLWAKSMDFWLFGSDHHITISLYFRYPNGLLVRYPILIKKAYKWEKVSINLIKGSHLKLYGKYPLELTKIRIHKKNETSPPSFTLFTAEYTVYNYQKNFTNRYINPYETHADMENGYPRHWHFTFNNNRVNPKSISQIKEHDKGYLVWKNNKNYLLLNIPYNIHKNRHLLIYFPVGYYKHKKGYYITLWIKGNSGGEQVSFVFQEGKWRYFELVLGEIYFTGWRKLTAQIPENQITFFRDPHSGQLYIVPIGMKISPGSNPKNPIILGTDQLESEIKGTKLNLDHTPSFSKSKSN